MCCSNSIFCCDISQDVAELEEEELLCKVEVSQATVKDSPSTLSEYNTIILCITDSVALYNMRQILLTWLK